MNNGHIEQIGTPDELYEKPETIFAASFIGTPPMNILEIKNSVIKSIDGPKIVETSKKVMLGIRPEHILIGINGSVPGRVLARDYLGAETIITVAIGHQTILVRINGRTEHNSGDCVQLGWDSSQTHLFEISSGQRKISTTSWSTIFE